ncbi:MAG: hypothetical protein R2863_04710 [Candidatus Kapaibacterium sp.]
MQALLIYIIMLTYSSNSFETIRHENIDIDKFEKYILIIIDGPSCHDCLIKLENTIVSNSKIKTILVFKTDGNIITRKSLIETYKKYIIPDIWLFYNDDSLFSEFETHNSPNVILKIENKKYNYHYNELFTKNLEESTFNMFYNLYKENCDV